MVLPKLSFNFLSQIKIISTTVFEWTTSVSTLSVVTDKP